MIRSDVFAGYVASSIGDGTRSSAATAYLEPILKRKNLDVLISTRVARVTGYATPSKITHIDTVEILQNPNGGHARNRNHTFA